MAEDNKAPAPAPYSSGEYRYQSALYFFLTGDYYSASELSGALVNTPATMPLPPAKDKANVLLRLSDSRIFRKRNYPDFTSQPLPAETPKIIKLLDAYYEMKEYDEVLSLAGSLRGNAAARYFEGMALVKLSRLGEADTALALVPAEDGFYPYAEIALAQIDVMRRDLKGAQGRLTALLSHPSVRDNGPGERARLLLGQILFERGLYPEALDEFMRVPAGSPLHPDALIGAAWSLERLGGCGNAAPLLKTAASSPSYDSTKQEARILLGICYLKLGEAGAGIEQFQGLMDALSDAGKRLELLINDRAARGRYLSILLEGDGAPLNAEEQRYVPMLRGDPNIAALIKERGNISLLKTDLLKRETDAAGQENYANNLMESLEERSRRPEENIRATKDMLLLMAKRKEEKEKLRGAVKENIHFLEIVEKNILKYWRDVIKYDAPEDTARLVRLILQEWVAESMECFNSAAICHVIGFLSMDKPAETPEQIRNIVSMLDTVAKDMAGAGRADKPGFEKRFARDREDIRKKVDKTKEALKRLETIRAEIKKGIKEIDKVSEENVESLDKYVKDNFRKTRYELEGVKADIMKELSIARKKAGA